ncbi:MAG: hypothetical protein AB9869_05340 [Verrucomicrobiia bacterium]
MTNGFQIAARFRKGVQPVGVACGIMLLLAGSACSPKVNRAVVGQWQNENGKERNDVLVLTGEGGSETRYRRANF